MAAPSAKRASSELAFSRRMRLLTKGVRMLSIMVSMLLSVAAAMLLGGGGPPPPPAAAEEDAGSTASSSSTGRTGGTKIAGIGDDTRLSPSSSASSGSASWAGAADGFSPSRPAVTKKRSAASICAKRISSTSGRRMATEPVSRVRSTGTPSRSCSRRSSRAAAVTVPLTIAPISGFRTLRRIATSPWTTATRRRSASEHRAAYPMHRSESARAMLRTAAIVLHLRCFASAAWNHLASHCAASDASNSGHSIAYAWTTSQKSRRACSC